MKKGGSLRSDMPEVAAWIDDLRTVFGREMIDEQLRRGMRGEVHFYASENGHVLGTPGPAGVPVTLPQAVDVKDQRKR